MKQGTKIKYLLLKLEFIKLFRRFLKWLHRHNLQVWMRSNQLRNGAPPRQRKQVYVNIDERLKYLKARFQERVASKKLTWQYLWGYLYKVSKAIGCQRNNPL